MKYIFCNLKLYYLSKWVFNNNNNIKFDTLIELIRSFIFFFEDLLFYISMLSLLSKLYFEIF